MNLFLDDIRNPSEACIVLHSEKALEFLHTHEYAVVGSYEQFKCWIENNGFPALISFDYILGEQDGKTGYDCAQWLVSYCAAKKIVLPEWSIHSSDPVGTKMIEALLHNYAKHINREPLSFHEHALISKAVLKYQPPVTLEKAIAQAKWLRENSRSNDNTSGWGGIKKKRY